VAGSPTPSSARARAALALAVSIAAVALLVVVPLVWFVAMPLGIVAATSGRKARRELRAHGAPDGMATAALALGSAVVVVPLLLAAVLITARTVDSSDDRPPSSVPIAPTTIGG
jgi:hypothetical protein